MKEVIHGDAFEALEDLETNSAHAAIVDYPWDFDAENGAGRYNFDHNIEGQDTSEGALFDMPDEERIKDVFNELARALESGSWVFAFADDEFVDTVRGAFRESDLTLRRNWAWTPKHIGQGYYGRINHYPIVTATNGETERYVTDRGTLIEAPNGRNTEYPTGKPVSVYRYLLKAPVLEDDERLLEPFCGAGPGAKVAAERNLGYWGVDVSEEAVELARDPFKQARL